MQLTGLRLQYRLGLPLIFFIAWIIAAVMAYLYVSISHKISSLSESNLTYTENLATTNITQFNKAKDAGITQLNEISELSLDQLKEFQLQAAEELLQLARRPFEKAFDTGDKRALKVWLKRQGEVSGVKEVTVFNREGITRFSSDESNLGRKLDATLLAQLTTKNEKFQMLSEKGVETFIPKTIERRCIRCHEHRAWEDKVGQPAGFFYLCISTAAFEKLKKENAGLLAKMKEESEATLTGLSTESQAAASMIRTENNQNVGNINRFNIRVFTLAILAILAASFFMVFLLVRIILTRPINQMVKLLDDCSDNVSASAQKLFSSSHNMAEHAANQAGSIEAGSSSLEELTAMTKQNSDHARQADSLMQESVRIITRADASMEKLTGSMSEISSASSETSRVVKTIEEISFQTNLLALNAAVEAARAGEAGAGFAVVAQEVRNLATRAATAAKDTSELIEKTIGKVEDGAKLVSQTYADFSEVLKSATQVAGIMGEIAAASGEQALGIEQINAMITEMDRVVQQIVANAQGSAGASEAMNEQSGKMKDMVENLIVLVKGTGGNTTNGSGPTVKNAKRLLPYSVKEAKRITQA
jgi:hypothetical protein